ncbi:MAG TPA: MBOAT family O-acyltransferase, partial [Chitinophagales bacterium]|nr:MBOAT family O-acyltransferase [Chitinophagales bacterium]
MVFASLIFLCLFLPLNILLYYSYNNATYRNYVLILFSLFFYAWGEPIWVLLLIFSAFVDYINALFIEHYRGTKYAKWGVVSSLIVNLGVLISFKYSGFLYENLNYYLGLSLTVPKIALPIGISFYTFQTISYTIDVYRGEVKAQTSFPKFLMFVSLYHQLVAGPIVRYVHIMNDIEQRKEKLEEIFWGLHRFLIGLFKKVAIANVAAVWVAQYLDGNFSELSVAEAWFGILMFSIQIYFDFSGYSDMAIGLGKMFGFHYLENFNYPYISRSATEFWRRWHISLGTFF